MVQSWFMLFVKNYTLYCSTKHSLMRQQSLQLITPPNQIWLRGFMSHYKLAAQSE
jgi:hypothetical protein